MSSTTKVLHLLHIFLLVTSLLHIAYIKCCIEEERLALLQIKKYMFSHSNPKDEVFADPWLDNGDTYNCCLWLHEVSCNELGHITKLDLSSKVIRDYHGDALNNPWLFNVTLFGPFEQLIYLDLSNNGINGLLENDGTTKISTLKNLQVLILDNNNLEIGYTSVSVLTSLQTLSLNGANLNESNFILSQELTNLRGLQNLYLSQNFFSQDIQVFCRLRYLQQLDLRGNQFSFGMPSCLRNLSSLLILDLSNNHFIGKVPSVLSNLTKLGFLDLSDNNFEGLWSLSTLANHSNLEVLWLSNNMLEVQTEDSSWQPKFQLRSLGLRNCNLNKPHGTIPKFLLHQYKLKWVDLSYNSLVGSFPTWLLYNNSELQSLYMANNSLIRYLHLPQSANFSLSTLDISRNNIHGKVPGNIGFIFPMLTMLNMSGNHFEGCIPTSIGEIRGLDQLDLSNNNFSGELPRRIFSNLDNLGSLLLSDNNLQGDLIPEEMSLPQLTWLKLSNNNLGGTIKDVLLKSSHLFYFDISSNKVTGLLPSWIGNFSLLHTLSMSKNNLKGPIPRELCKLKLNYLDLSQNYLNGSIPSCSKFSSLSYMHLHSNSLTGPIPRAISGCTKLKILDLRDNLLFGDIPHWIGKLSMLVVLLLGGNSLSGEIPNHMCQLKNMNILDLSNNNLLGGIPKCFGNMSFGIKSESQNYAPQILQGGGLDYDVTLSLYSIPEEVDFLQKNQYLAYTSGVLVLMSGLDLSRNNLTGIIPSELAELRKIHSLNISHNQLHGSIPASLSRLKQLESLDLSYNNLSGAIPSQLVELNFLVVFNVSYNNLAGKVPISGQFADFDQTSYLANQGLYGFPNSQVHNITTVITPNTTMSGKRDEDIGAFMVDFLWSFGMSCTIMFIATVAIIWINPQWRQAWFGFVDWHLLWFMPVSLLS